MIFSSIEFIFIFLPFFLFLYFIIPEKYKNYIILILSILIEVYLMKKHKEKLTKEDRIKLKE